LHSTGSGTFVVLNVIMLVGTRTGTWTGTGTDTRLLVHDVEPYVLVHLYC